MSSPIGPRNGAARRQVDAAVSETHRRKVVTILFSDVTGSTSLGEQLDPESLRGVMGRFYDIARSVVARHGGVVEKFIGDALMAVFGVPERLQRLRRQHPGAARGTRRVARRPAPPRIFRSR